MNAFTTMLHMMMDLQVSIFTVEMLRERWCGDYADTYHIIVPDGYENIIDYAFIRRGKDEYILIYATSIDMKFSDAMTHYSTKVIRDQGSKLTLYG